MSFAIVNHLHIGGPRVHKEAPIPVLTPSSQSPHSYTDYGPITGWRTQKGFGVRHVLCGAQPPHVGRIRIRDGGNLSGGAFSLITMRPFVALSSTTRGAGVCPYDGGTILGSSSKQVM